MKNHYLITQKSDMLVKFYEDGIKEINELKRKIEHVSKGLLESLGKFILTE